MEGTEVPSFYCMSSNTAAPHIESLIHAIFKEGRCGDFYIVDIEIKGNNQIVVYVDGDEGLSLENCKQISRTIESVLDEEQTLGGIYGLEISSPGVNRPLKFLRQYIKHIGRLLQIKMLDGTEVEGLLKECVANGVLIEITPKEKKGVPEVKEILFDDIQETYVKVQFGKLKKEKKEKKKKKK
jgi:ribosome maturation factor RimP